MIIGLLDAPSGQKDVLPAAVRRALDALRPLDLLNLPLGRYELEGEQMFFLLQEGVPRALADSRAEAHRRYADIQMPLGASERFGCALPVAVLLPTEDRLDVDDIAFYPPPPGEFFLDLAPGAFVVFLPGELHRPCLSIEDRRPFRKVVVKVDASLLGQ